MTDPASPANLHRAAFAARLRSTVKAFGGVSALARAIGRSEGAVRKWLRGSSEPGVTDIFAISQACQVSAEWLVTGQKGRGPSDSTGIEESIAAYRIDSSKTVNAALLEQILSVVEEENTQYRLQVNSYKRSSLVSTLYSLFQGTGVVDRDSISRLLKLAA
jgi:transcriptional regulator with XRE-family HTH domain